MIGRPPSAWFIGAVAVLCVGMLGVESLIAIDANAMFSIVLGAAVAVAVVIGRTALALWRRKDDTAVPRSWIPVILLAFAFFLLLASAPSRTRLLLSQNSLDRYAATVTSTPQGCSDSTFRERSVGLYRIGCAERQADGAVLLLIDEPLVPSGGAPWLIGPGDWRLWLQD